MRKILDNPYIVGLLVMIALVVYFKEPIMKFVNKFRSAPAVATTTTVTGDQSSEKSQLPALTQEMPGILPDAKIETDKIQWILKPSRDPFRGKKRGDTKPDTPPTNIIEKTTPPKPPLKLKAVVIEGEKKFAVINDKIVEEGESLLDYRVLSIARDFVVLEGFGEKRKLTFSESAEKLEE